MVQHAEILIYDIKYYFKNTRVRPSPLSSKQWKVLQGTVSQSDSFSHKHSQKKFSKKLLDNQIKNA